MEDVLVKDLGNDIYYWVDAVLFLLFTITVLYLLLFAIISQFKRRDIYPPAKENYKIALVLLVFDSDWDVEECLNSYLNQEYPSDKYKIFVVGTNITRSMQNKLQSMNINCKVYENGTLNRTTLLSNFVTDLDNTDLDNEESFEFIAMHSVYDKIDSNFLSKVNDALYAGCDVVQTHCKLANKKSIWNVYKSISAEINNSIFRKAHCHISLSSALSATGTVISMNLLKMCLKKDTNVGVEKQFEKMILQNHYYIEYLDSVYTYGDETAKKDMAYEQKRYNYHLKNMIRTLFYIPFAMLQGNIDYINKLFQWVLPPRLVLIATIGIFGCLASYMDIFASIKWWVLLIVLIATFFIAIPSSLITARVLKLLLMIPVVVFILYLVWYINV